MALLPRYCFVSYTDVEQEEAGDTIHHTFLIAPWMVGETRWYYFLGTINGAESKSRSALFEYTRVAIPTTAYFYPDADPEVTSVDGDVAQNNFESWYTIHAGPGQLSSDTGTTSNLQIKSATNGDDWALITRIFLLFDTSSIPLGSQILRAKLRVKVYYRNYPPDWVDADYCIVYSWPHSNVALIPNDFQRIASSPLSDVIPITQPLEADNYQTFTLNDSGKLWIISGGITKLGLREYSHDCRNVPYSPWLRLKTTDYQIYMADKGGDYRPRLQVTYEAA
ncbi:hypothetical protein ES708_24168 [subsurface metagenome]